LIIPCGYIFIVSSTPGIRLKLGADKTSKLDFLYKFLNQSANVRFWTVTATFMV